MAFQEFKTEIANRAKEKQACAGEYKKDLKSKYYQVWRKYTTMKKTATKIIIIILSLAFLWLMEDINQVLINHY